MNANYNNFIEYLKSNDIKFDENRPAKLIRFGYNIEVGTIEIVVDFENDRRIGFFSFLNLTIPQDKKAQSLDLLNSFNESLNYGCIIVSQINQLVYKIMLSTLGTIIDEEQWSEIIFRLWSISKDIYPLFGRIIYIDDDPQLVFNEFLKMKEHSISKNHSQENPTQEPVSHESAVEHNVEVNNSSDQNPEFWKDFKNWFLQN